MRVRVYLSLHRVSREVRVYLSLFATLAHSNRCLQDDCARGRWMTVTYGRTPPLPLPLTPRRQRLVAPSSIMDVMKRSQPRNLSPHFHLTPRDLSSEPRELSSQPRDLSPQPRDLSSHLHLTPQTSVYNVIALSSRLQDPQTTSCHTEHVSKSVRSATGKHQRSSTGSRVKDHQKGTGSRV